MEGIFELVEGKDVGLGKRKGGGRHSQMQKAKNSDVGDLHQQSLPSDGQ